MKMKTKEYNKDYDLVITHLDWGYYTYIHKHTGKEIGVPLWIKEEELLEYLVKNTPD